MSPIRFESRCEIARFHDPLHGMELRDHPVEIRRDPLTGRTAVASAELATKAEMFFGSTDWELVRQVAQQSREGCFFCPERVREVTPRYPEELLPGGRLEVGRALLFPNLFPLAAVHAVCCFPEHHLLLPAEFAPDLLTEAFTATAEFARRLRGAGQDPTHLSICCNHLPPAGASLAHPHLQVYGGETPPATLAFLWERSSDFRREHGVPYWSALVEAEAGGERWIARDEGCSWLAPFAPVGGREVVAVLPGLSRLADLQERDAAALARGISRVLDWYQSENLSAFNFTVYSGPPDGSAGEFPLVLSLIARSAFQREYRCDDYFLQRQLGSELVVDSPERIAMALRDCW